MAVARAVTGPTLVLGSTQVPGVASSTALRSRGVNLVRRRSGGGAVYLVPDDPLWLDAWIPRDDPFWRHDVSEAAEWVGHWWCDALGRHGLHGFDVHAGRASPGDWGGLVCFAGRGPGEVFLGARKIVGLSQWRAREGALFSSCAYRHWDPRPLVEVLDLDAGAGVVADADSDTDGDADSGTVADRVTAQLRPLAAGLDELDPPLEDLRAVGETLVASLESFGRGQEPAPAPLG